LLEISMDATIGRIFQTKRWFSRHLVDEFNYAGTGLLKNSQSLWGEWDNLTAAAAQTIDPRFTLTGDGRINFVGAAAGKFLIPIVSPALAPNYSFAFSGSFTGNNRGFDAQTLYTEIKNDTTQAVKIANNQGLFVQLSTPVLGTQRVTIGIQGGASTNASTAGDIRCSVTVPIVWSVVGQVKNRQLTATLNVFGLNSVGPATLAGTATAGPLDVSANAYNSTRGNVCLSYTNSFLNGGATAWYDRVDVAPL
jgi:hypothetical protein